MKARPSDIQDTAEEPLLELLLNEVVPRLARRAPGTEAGGTPTPRARPVSGSTSGPAAPLMVAGPLYSRSLELARLCQQGEHDAATTMVAELRAAGVPLEAVFLQLIQPAAQHLGQGWLEDRISFTDVTIGTAHLQRLVSAASDEFVAENSLENARESTEAAGTRTGGASPRSVFFCTPKNTHHRLGIQMVRTFFARQGWRTRIAHDDEPALIRQIVTMQPSLVGISVATDADLRQAAGFILRVRNATSKLKPAIMVGGPATAFSPELTARLEADIICGDPLDALAKADRLLTERQFGTR